MSKGYVATFFFPGTLARCTYGWPGVWTTTFDFGKTPSAARKRSCTCTIGLAYLRSHGGVHRIATSTTLAMFLPSALVANVWLLVLKASCQNISNKHFDALQTGLKGLQLAEQLSANSNKPSGCY